MNRPHSYSSLSTLATCCQKFDYAYNHRIEAPGVNLPMAAGSAIDAALNVLYTVSWDLDEALGALTTAWGDTSAPFGAKHDWLTLVFLQEVVAQYVADREASPTILERGEIVEAFSGEMHVFDWHGDGGLVRLRGIPDFILRHDRKTYVVDLKATTQWIGSHWLHQFRVGNQLRVYAAMVQAELGEIVHGGLINAVYMGKGAIADEATWKRRKSVRNALHPIDFTQGQIEEAHRWVRGWIEVEETCRRTGLWPRNERACGDYGGCEFLPLCTASDDVVRDAMMMTRYGRREER